ncbi:MULTISPECIES: SDR family NAD(P)-dependent oxidoreductase [unclassified Arthrobacter]|uniref:SDR family NAD(P)-dependent oxidoreductase n=1 Tax=unclassified Arthrobacter TaxID=235627 RepID=UPI002E0666C9|nr:MULTISPECIES: SDR family NAD(P)-dependent oxidoreductase [unclassified Arthrobacter]MEC5192006.1 NAD(P)-dependent dehydrogenase (short-subunit alcohol dehydrogenase family) [Arthrobacter sp. MP_M4]MEC5203581.1 NAD(P)-dependent dehydrogenase (short-subunit alcohol dehydrogenase family) [Arthrobacter sp. MP_M7]
MDIKGTVALITGGASGLGAATARRLFAAGASVVLVDLPGSAGDALAAELNAGPAADANAGGNKPEAPRGDSPELTGRRAVFVPADVTREAEVQAAVDAAAALGPLRIVVNCAGIATPGKVLGRDGVLPLETFNKVIQINVVGTFNVIRLAAAAMAATEPAVTGLGGPERGVIINTASVAAFDGQIGQPAYAASKGAVHAMTLPIARELARSLIRVVTIAPGIFETPMMAGLPQEAQDSLGRQVPHPSRLGRPAEYANLAAHIVDNAMLNGETIRLDGAIRMGPK